MNPNPLWSWVLFAAGAFGLFIAGQWLPWGWLVGASMQGFYITYGLVTRQYGFIASGLMFAGISLLNFWKAWKMARKPLRSKSGLELTDEVVERFSQEMAEGYDPSRLRPRYLRDRNEKDPPEKSLGGHRRG